MEADFMEAQNGILTTMNNTVALATHRESILILINDICKMVYIENINDENENHEIGLETGFRFVKQETYHFMVY